MASLPRSQEFADLRPKAAFVLFHLCQRGVPEPMSCGHRCARFDESAQARARFAASITRFHRLVQGLLLSANVPRWGYSNEDVVRNPAGAAKPQLRWYWNKREDELKLLNPIKKFVLDESGLETVEWAIVGGIIVAGAAALLVLIGADVVRGIAALGATTSQIPAP